MNDMPKEFDPTDVPEGMISTYEDEVVDRGLLWRYWDDHDDVKRSSDSISRRKERKAPVLAYLPPCEPVGFKERDLVALRGTDRVSKRRNGKVLAISSKGGVVIEWNDGIGVTTHRPSEIRLVSSAEPSVCISLKTAEAVVSGTNQYSFPPVTKRALDRLRFATQREQALS